MPISRTIPLPGLAGYAAPMSSVTNLNRFRKAKARAAKRAKADENAVRFGQSRVEREAQALRAEKAARDLSGHKLEGPKDR